MKVQKQEFLAYEEVRKLGAYNMFDQKALELVNSISETEIDIEKYVYIINHYTELAELYLK